MKIEQRRPLLDRITTPEAGAVAAPPRARQTPADAFDELSGHGSVAAAPEPHPLLEAAARAGRAELTAGLRAYGAVLRDPEQPAEVRARAAVAAGHLALGAKARQVADLFVTQAELLQPGREDTQRLGLAIHRARLATGESLKLLDQLLATSPGDAELHRMRSVVLLEDARPDDAVEAGLRAVKLASAAAPNGEAHKRALLTLAAALQKTTRTEETIRVLKAALKLAPEDRAAHQQISERVLPDLKNAALRAAIKPKFNAANAAYQAGDFERARTLALEILRLDEDDGLAHRLFAIAEERLAERAAKTPLLPVFADAEKQRALVDHFVEVTGRARLGGEGRRGRPEDLFPDWRNLTTLQRAVVAHSVLPFGAVIPALMEKGAKFRFALPGTSLCEVDPQADITKKKAFGRHSYAGRGWAYKASFFVACGAEKIDAAAFGKHNTITHEFAHLVHYHMRDLAAAREQGRPLSVLELRLAEAYPQLEALYQRAKDGEGGQKLLEAYSGTNVWEYFAQGMMAYVAPTRDNKENPARLGSRNPELFDLMASLAAGLADLPREVPRPRPERPEAAQLRATPAKLAKLAQGAKSAHLQALASGVWDRLLLDATTSQNKAELDAHVARHLARAGELVAIATGTLAPNHLGDPERTLAEMGRAELEAQVMLELRQASQQGAQGEGPDLRALQALRRELAAAPADLAPLRARLLALHA